MKKICLVFAMFFVGLFSAQQNENHEVVDQMVKSTYFHDNGQIKTSGFYKDGKLHGTWIAYDENGVKTAMGQYEDGKKIGKWFFWNNSLLNEVDYTDYRINQVKTWQSTAVPKN